VPGGHTVHDPAATRLYRPAGHGTAVPEEEPSGQAYPAVHARLHSDVNPGVGLYCPAAHGAVHAAVVKPVVLPKDPAGQAVHPPAPATLYLPVEHSEGVEDTDPAGQAYPAEQLQAHGVPRAVTLLQVPAVQLVHVPLPPTLNLPAEQALTDALVDPAGQAYPGVQLPLHADDNRPGVAP
jgi:hypothetical protein